MLYDNILIDVFNLYYRVKSHTIVDDALGYAREVITRINTDIKSHLVENGNIYLLYDPIPKDDLGFDKSFKKMTARQNDLSVYKSNRVHDAKICKALFQVKKYFSHRGEHFINVISNGEFEADDFVEPLLKDLTGDIALVTTDEDWARYLNDKVVMINDIWDKPFTVESFKEKYNFIPNIASVSFYKACFGDGSDNIPGALNVKIKSNDLKKKAFEVVQLFGMVNPDLEKVISEFKTYSYKALLDKAEKSIVEDLFLLIEAVDLKYSISTNLITNLNVIKCRCKSYKEYVHFKPVDEKYNKIIEKVLGFKTDVIFNKKPKFGMLRSK